MAIPRRTKEAIDRYVQQHLLPGGFLEAVLSNNLMDAVCRADSENLEALVEICKYIYNEIPSKCHGSPEKVKAWVDQSERTRSQR